MTIPDLPDVAGYSLDGETYTIESDENRALCESLGVAPDPEGKAHPIYYYIATQVAMGETVAGLCNVCAFDIEDGPMMGGSNPSFNAPLMVDEPYQVRGQIDSIVRKESRKLGIMDIMTYTLHLDRLNGERMCSATNSWIFPRGQKNED
ncbi:MAG: hypothetical protein CL814_10500 [Confluentimicrobium sp.]|jgi:hypothetical protein|uniref:hypothetical protein n=1 Tax=Actibacterium sp. TaxID=1872125 RepID=UPI00050EF5DE|nr:hypothetical protein [Actibacterium sp.]KGB83317.1 hypothetical protein JT55_03150 [Rhodovulum sp. NI22]MBC57354.1 hypothetical protein [Actibacterium sp.]MDY6860781.1 hypothetical protein [Pseudomonadota bacterium]|tara:strand:- start:5788 stop:6234 length:447 start_codon:yes stop_codon:yes gene_type:complete